MIVTRKAEDRGKARLGWLDTRYSFSFADYYDPEHMGFGPLRVINQDRIAKDAGFPQHGHKDMEILTYVLNGAVRHEDSTGGIDVVRKGEIQLMTAGKGIEHSEWNASADEELELLQIWIQPTEAGREARYQKRDFRDKLSGGRLVCVLSIADVEDALPLAQEGSVFAAWPPAGAEEDFSLGRDQIAWLQVARGQLEVNGHALEAGDGAAIRDEDGLRIRATQDSDYLLFVFPAA